MDDRADAMAAQGFVQRSGHDSPLFFLAFFAAALRSLASIFFSCSGVSLRRLILMEDKELDMDDRADAMAAQGFVQRSGHALGQRWSKIKPHAEVKNGRREDHGLLTTVLLGLFRGRLALLGLDWTTAPTLWLLRASYNGRGMPWGNDGPKSNVASSHQSQEWAKGGPWPTHHCSSWPFSRPPCAPWPRSSSPALVCVYQRRRRRWRPKSATRPRTRRRRTVVSRL
jgi:hypothetical protein